MTCGERFVEVETAEGEGVGIDGWDERSDGFWQLGPLYAAGPVRAVVAALRAENARLTVALAVHREAVRWFSEYPLGTAGPGTARRRLAPQGMARRG